MIDEDTFRKTEDRICRYYNNLKKIDKLEYKCLVLEKQKEQLRQDIRETKVNIEPELNMGIDYSREAIQTSSDGASYSEKACIKEVEKLIDEWKWTRRKILQLHANIRDIKKQNSDLEYIISKLNTKYRLISEMKYKDELSLDQIGTKLYIDKSTVSRSMERIVRDVSKFLYL